MLYTCVLWKSFRQMSESSLTPIVFEGEVFSFGWASYDNSIPDGIENFKIEDLFTDHTELTWLRRHSSIDEKFWWTYHEIGSLQSLGLGWDTCERTENSWLNHILHEQNQILSSNSWNYPLTLGCVSVWLSVHERIYSQFSSAHSLSNRHRTFEMNWIDDDIGCQELIEELLTNGWDCFV